MMCRVVFCVTIAFVVVVGGCGDDDDEKQPDYEWHAAVYTADDWPPPEQLEEQVLQWSAWFGGEHYKTVNAYSFSEGLIRDTQCGSYDAYYHNIYVSTAIQCDPWAELWHQLTHHGLRRRDGDADFRHTNPIWGELTL